METRATIREQTPRHSRLLAWVLGALAILAVAWLISEVYESTMASESTDGNGAVVADEQ